MKKYILIILTVLLCTSPLYAGTQLNQSKWDSVLDVAYLLSYGDGAYIRKELNKFKKEFNQSLESYVENSLRTFQRHAKQGVSKTTDPESSLYSENAYRRLATAELLLYLSSRDTKRLNDYYIKAHEAIELNKTNPDEASESFTRNVFKIWIDVILKIEELQDALRIPNLNVQDANKLNNRFILSLPFLYENMANLILDRAIIENQVSNLEALGSIIWLLEYRMSDPEGYINEVELVTNRIYGPKSDVYRLTYTVNYLEAERSRKLAQNEMLEKGISGSAEAYFSDSRTYYNLAYGDAKTSQGQAAVITDYLNLSSFVISKLPQRADLRKDSLFTALPGHDGDLTINNAVNLYEKLSKPAISYKDWSKQGFPDKKTYTAAMHDLCRAVMELSYWTAEYYIQDVLISVNNEDMLEKIPPARIELLQSLEFFERDLRKGNADIVPDNSYLNAAMASAKLSNIYFLKAPYSTDMANYNSAFGRLLQYIEMYPFNPAAILELARRLNEAGTQKFYIQYVMPVADRVKNSEAIKGWIAKNRNETLTPEIETLHKIIPDIIMSANTIAYLQDLGEDSVKTKLNNKLKLIAEKSQRYLQEEKSDSVYNANLDIHGNTKKLIDELLNIKVKTNDSQHHKRIAATINQLIALQEKVKDLDRARHLLKNMHTYEEMNEKITEELNRKVNHPAHSLLRDFYQEQALNSMHYYWYLIYNTAKKTEKQKLLHQRVSR
jgi:hypothetical protein